MTGGEPYPNFSREIFWVLRKSLNFIILEWDKSDRLSIDVAVNNHGEAHSCQLCNYEITLQSKSVNFPVAEKLFEGDPTFSKLLTNSEDEFPLRIERFLITGNSCNVVTEKVRYTSADDHQSCQSSRDEIDIPEASKMVLKITCCFADVTNSVSLFKTYLHYLKVCYEPNFFASLSLVEDPENHATDFNFVCSDFAAYVNKTVLTCVSSGTEHSGFITLKMPLTVESVKVRLTVATFCGPTKGPCGVLCVYLLGPFGLPIINESDSVSAWLEQLVSWESYGVVLSENLNTLQYSGLLPPYFTKKLSFNKVNAFDLTIFLVFDADKPPSLQDKVHLSDKVQRCIEEIMTLNMEASQRSCSQALEQTMLQSKDAFRKRCNEISTATTVSSIFDIVVYSTNNEFRDACLSLLNSATTHGFREDLYEVLSEYTKKKLENKRHKRRLEEDNDDLEWKLLEENTQTL